MKSILDIMYEFVHGWSQLKKIVSEKAKDDWDKLWFLTENDEVLDKKVSDLFRDMDSSLDEFREATSLGTIFSYPLFCTRLTSFLNHRNNTNIHSLDD